MTNEMITKRFFEIPQDVVEFFENKPNTPEEFIKFFEGNLIIEDTIPTTLKSQGKHLGCMGLRLHVADNEHDIRGEAYIWRAVLHRKFGEKFMEDVDKIIKERIAKRIKADKRRGRK